MRRTLSLSAIVSIIFFNVSGGPYALEDVLASGAGFGLLLIVVTPFIWSLPVALVCAELGSALPEEGGYYAWSKRALGPFGAFCQGWWAWLFTLVDIGIFPTMFCDYLAYFYPEFAADGNYWLRRGVMIAMIWGFVLLNMRGARTIGNFARVFLVLVLAPFGLMVAFGLYRGFVEGFEFSPVHPFLSPGRAIGPAFAAAAPVILWNFQGWDSISTIAGEMQNPKRDYPRALFITVLLVMTIYLIPALVALAHVGVENVTWTSGAWSLAAEHVAGSWLGKFTSATGMVAAVGLYSGLVLVYSRVPYVMSRDGYFPKAMARTNSNGAPWVSLTVCGVLYTIIILVFRDVTELAAADVTCYAGLVTLELVSFLVLRRREPDLERPFRVPGGWPLAVGLCLLPLCCFGMAISFGVLENGLWSVVGKAWVCMSIGPALYPVLTWLRDRRDAANVGRDQKAE